MAVPYDAVGDIVIFKFPYSWPNFFKKFYASNFLRKNKKFKVALDKVSGFSGNLRVQKTKFISGERRKNTMYKENESIFYVDVDKTYFSSRLSEERRIVSNEILKQIKKRKIKNPKILVLFSGVSPQAIVLAKTLKKNKVRFEIISSELNKDACEMGKKNVLLNKVSEFVKIQCGDSRKLCFDLAKKKKKFDFILMPRPNIEDTFLNSVFKVSKKGTQMFYHGFGTKGEVEEEILQNVKKSRHKISRLIFRKAGEIGVKKFRWNVTFEILN